MRHTVSCLGLGFAGLLVSACQTERRSSFEATSDPSPTFGAPSSDESGSRPTCVATQTKASHAAVDVIVVIDTSGSMSEETEQVRQNLNAFARSIGEGGLDYHVIMIARKPRDAGSSFGICVQPPLAGEGCRDTSLFHHLDVDVESYDSLSIVLDQYPNYEKWLRPNAYKVFIEVTDDDSALGWESFDRRLLATSTEQFGDEAERRYIFNAICGYARGSAIPSSEHCATAVNSGSQYQALSQLTGGTVESVCETSYASVFDTIADDLVTRVGCEFVFPTDDGKGRVTDPASLVMKYTRGGGAVTNLTQVTDASKCESVVDGWYYDDPYRPSKMLLCAKTCGVVGVDASAKVDIDVGCKAPVPK